MRIFFFRGICFAFSIFFLNVFFAYTANSQTIESATLLGRPIVTRSDGDNINSSSSSSSRTAIEKEIQKTETEEFSATRNTDLSALRGYSTGSVLFDTYIVESSRRYRIDPLLIYAQMHQESAFKLRARSHKGASGLMQLMPTTAVRFGVTDIYNPKQNIDAGVKYMRWLLDKFGGDVRLALAGYNAGEGAVMKFGNQIPPYRETQEYVRRIITRYNSISNQYIALPASDTAVAAKANKVVGTTNAASSETDVDLQNEESENRPKKNETNSDAVNENNTVPRTVLTKSLFLNPK